MFPKLENEYDLSTEFQISIPHSNVQYAQFEKKYLIFQQDL